MDRAQIFPHRNFMHAWNIIVCFICTHLPSALRNPTVTSNTPLAQCFFRLCPLTVNWLTVQRVYLKLARRQRLKKLPQSIVSWQDIPIPHQGCLVQVETGQVLGGVSKWRRLRRDKRLTSTKHYTVRYESQSVLRYWGEMLFYCPLWESITTHTVSVP